MTVSCMNFDRKFKLNKVKREAWRSQSAVTARLPNAETSAAEGEEEEISAAGEKGT